MLLVKRNLVIKNTNIQPTFTCPKSTTEIPEQGVCHVISLYGYLTLWEKVINGSHHSAKFSGNKCYSSGDIMVLDCHVISSDHVTKGWSNILE